MLKVIFTGQFPAETCLKTNLSLTRRFLSNKYPDRADPEIVKACQGDEGGLLVSVAAAKAVENETETTDLAATAFEMFLGIFGAHVGNSAVKFIPSQGIYLAGGILPKNLRYLQSERGRSIFLDKFADKGRMRPLIEKMPVKVVKNDDIAIQGSQVVAKRLLRARFIKSAMSTVQSNGTVPSKDTWERSSRQNSKL